MQNGQIMSLKYPYELSTFSDFLETCGFGQVPPEVKGNATRYKLSTGVIVNLYANGTIQLQGNVLVIPHVEKTIEEHLNVDSPAIETCKKIFIVHGHDHTSKEQLELILHKLGLTEQFILQNTGGSGLTIIEELEKEIGKNQVGTRFGIVLLTPDDIGYSKKEGEETKQARPRQNVVLEMGMLLSSLGRENVAILQKQHLEQPSDANGILYLHFNEHVKETVPRLAQRLQKSGFIIDSDKIASASS
ncbi:TPA: TIR domain-containing protein [Providencia alcalifaciens]